MKKMGKRVAVFFVMLSVLCSTLVPSMPIIGAEVDQSKWITSGIYQYEVLDADKKTITIWRINSSEPNIEIPKMIDGYNVVCLGGIYENGECVRVMGVNSAYLKSLKIPDTVKEIGPCAFEGCSNLEKIDFSKKAYFNIELAAFEDCSKIKKIDLFSCGLNGRIFNSKMKRVEFNDVIVRCGGGDGPDGNFGPTDTIVLNGDSECTLCNFRGRNYIKAVYVNDTSYLYFCTDEGVLTTIKKLYVNGVLAELAGSAEQVENLYTVPSAKAISSAKKAHVTYHVKTTGSMKKVTRKKKGKKYQYSWKPVKTTIKTYKYRGKKKGWKCTKKKAATQYYVYAKKNRLDDYQLIQTTKKKQITTSYKYVKVKPVKIWLD